MQELQQRLERRKRQKRLEQKESAKKKYRIFARYAYTTHKWISTDEVGTFKELLAKYKGKKDVEFYCADIPPRINENGKVTADEAYRISEDNLSSYGNHKCWLDPELSSALGKKVFLVWNAA
jgi:hypothetical protein